MSVFVSTPCRLHFGLLRFEQIDGPSFGGLGMMIDRPRLELEVAATDRWSGSGPEKHAKRALASLTVSERPTAVRVVVRQAIPRHAGLGSGTQMALAIAAGVRSLAGLPATRDAEQLAHLVGRGRRSGVGSHGFLHGGLIWELGRQGDESLSPLAARVEMPATWRIVLVTPNDRPGLHGGSEQEAFDKLPPVPAATTEMLERLAENRILPAARRADLVEFGEAVYDYGRLAGECFASVQGGPYASPAVADCVAAIRALGVRGAGQSSWGPTVFAMAESQSDAESLVRDLSAKYLHGRAEIEIARPDNRGAVIDESCDVFGKIASELSS